MAPDEVVYSIMNRVNRDFDAPDPIPAEAQQLVARILQSGRLFRYQRPAPATALTSTSPDKGDSHSSTESTTSATEHTRKISETTEEIPSSVSVHDLNLDDLNALCEQAVADYIGVPYALGVNSGGCALFLALKACGLEPGEEVLTNAYTLSPVPGAIVHAGGKPIFVDCRAETFSLDVEVGLFVIG